MVDFWTLHGVGFIICMFFFPRLTMLFATTAGGGMFYWLGWFFMPRITVAALATFYFGHTNTFLVVLTWIWAIGGESTEKAACSCRAN